MVNRLSCVLIVEDDTISSFVTIRAIKQHDLAHQIKVCISVEEALKFMYSRVNANETLPELIFLDIHLTTQDGFDFIFGLKNIPTYPLAKPIVCVLTNSTHPSDKEKFEESGMHEYLLKPLTKEKVTVLYEKYFR